MWTCPKCGAKVDPSFEVCWQCGTSADGTEDPSFVSADQSGPIADESSDPMGGELPPVEDGPGGELVACYQAFSLMEAQFLTDELKGEGITAVCDAQDMQDAIGGWSGNPRVYCHESDLPRARAFLEEYEKKKAGHNPLES